MRSARAGVIRAVMGRAGITGPSRTTRAGGGPLLRTRRASLGYAAHVIAWLHGIRRSKQLDISDWQDG